MCCLSEASSHFVVFVCVNPDRKPSRKMKRLNKIGESGTSTGSVTDSFVTSDERQATRDEKQVTSDSFGTKFAVVYKNV